MAPGSKTFFCTKNLMLMKMGGLTVVNVTLPVKQRRNFQPAKDVVAVVAVVAAVAQGDQAGLNNLDLRIHPTLCGCNPKT